MSDRLVEPRTEDAVTTLLVEGGLFSEEQVFSSQGSTGSCKLGNKMHAVGVDRAYEMGKLS